MSSGHLTNGQNLGFHGCQPPPMLGTNELQESCKAIVAQGWIVQVQEPSCDDTVRDGWLTLARHRDQADPRSLQLSALTAPAWCHEGGLGALFHDKAQAIDLAVAVVAREAKVGLCRPVRIFHAYAGVSEEVR